MPEMDGYGVLHAIHKNDAIKSTFFITGFGCPCPAIHFA